ncbi:MAG: hypothetical protein C0434_07800 [Xanthomonadaceae bacterium]|nr:hypothetical protein [Xanthomonadaceae bacterium]
MLPMSCNDNPHLIFATNFSEACHAAIPMVAHWVDTLQARLTLLHVHPRGAGSQAARSLDSFFAESAHYPSSSRQLLSGNAAAGIAEFCRQHPQAMLVMPPSVRSYLPRPLHVSLRTQVLRQVATPMLTMLPDSKAIPELPALGGHVACWITGDEPRLDHVREAAALARQRDAELHLLFVLPEVSEGLMLEALYSDRPLAEPAAIRLLDDIAARIGDQVRVRVHLDTGSTQRSLARLLRASRASLLVVDRDTVVRKRLLRGAFASALRDSPCLLICVPARSHDDDGDRMPPPNARQRPALPPSAGLVRRHRPAAKAPRSWLAWDGAPGLLPA